MIRTLKHQFESTRRDTLPDTEQSLQYNWPFPVTRTISLQSFYLTLWPICIVTILAPHYDDDLPPHFDESSLMMTATIHFDESSLMMTATNRNHTQLQQGCQWHTDSAHFSPTDAIMVIIITTIVIIIFIITVFVIINIAVFVLSTNNYWW